ncbi:MAG: hypothetical protein JKY31_12345 [Rhodobacteraceae bacterium]|nr:hypothetical protein [Paracoccaceae bacterium]
MSKHIRKIGQSDSGRLFTIQSSDKFSFSSRVDVANYVVDQVAVISFEDYHLWVKIGITASGIAGTVLLYVNQQQEAAFASLAITLAVFFLLLRQKGKIVTTGGSEHVDIIDGNWSALKKVTDTYLEMSSSENVRIVANTLLRRGIHVVNTHNIASFSAKSKNDHIIFFLVSGAFIIAAFFFDEYQLPALIACAFSLLIALLVWKRGVSITMIAGHREFVTIRRSKSNKTMKAIADAINSRDPGRNPADMSELDSKIVSLDQKLANLKNQRTHVSVKPAAPIAVVAPIAAAAPVAAPTYDEATVVANPAPEPFPEPMPAYMPETTHAPESQPVPHSTSQSIPFPGPAPAHTLGTTGGYGAPSKFAAAPVTQYDHSNQNRGASVDAPILGPAKKD